MPAAHCSFGFFGAEMGFFGTTFDGPRVETFPGLGLTVGGTGDGGALFDGIGNLNITSHWSMSPRRHRPARVKADQQRTKGS